MTAGRVKPAIPEGPRDSLWNQRRVLTAGRLFERPVSPLGKWAT